jgi:hypothetical protein
LPRRYAPRNDGWGEGEGSLMEIGAIIVAIILAFIALKFVAGVVKFVVLGAIILGLLYFTGVIG